MDIVIGRDTSATTSLLDIRLPCRLWVVPKLTITLLGIELHDFSYVEAVYCAEELTDRPQLVWERDNDVGFM